MNSAKCTAYPLNGCAHPQFCVDACAGRPIPGPHELVGALNDRPDVQTKARFVRSYPTQIPQCCGCGTQTLTTEHVCPMIGGASLCNCCPACEAECRAVVKPENVSEEV